MGEVPIPDYADIPESAPCGRCGHQKWAHGFQQLFICHIGMPGIADREHFPCDCQFFDPLRYIAEQVDRAARIDVLRRVISRAEQDMRGFEFVVRDELAELEADRD